ncbi:MAG TPA: hypothetical protein VK425_04755, partial [Acidimicrobiales bacterium]|nr:hypothetical protein [Acidimicrobiales bacterium]
MTIAPERTRKTSASEDAAARAGSDALVLDAAMKQALATTRSLGRAGLGVALADCAPGGTLGTVPAFRSRWSVSRGVLPDFNLDPDAYAAGVLELVKAQKTRAVVPLSDQSIASLRPWREKVEAHAPLALAADAALDIASDKSKTLVLASQLGLSAPRTVQARTEQEVLDALDEVGFPAVLKPTVPWSRERGGPR